MTWFEQNAKLCHINNNTLVVERNVPSLAYEWSWVRLSPTALVALVMRHNLDGTGWVNSFVFVFRVWVRFH